MRTKVHLTKVSGNRLWPVGEGIESDVDMENDLTIHGHKDDGDFLRTEFTVSMGYNPSVGRMSMEGEAWTQGNEEELTSVRKGEGYPFERVSVTILRACILRAVNISEYVNLPAPVPLPTYKEGPGDEDPKGGVDYHG